MDELLDFLKVDGWRVVYSSGHTETVCDGKGHMRYHGDGLGTCPIALKGVGKYHAATIGEYFACDCAKRKAAA